MERGRSVQAGEGPCHAVQGGGVVPFSGNSRMFNDIREGGNHILDRLGYSVKELELFLLAMRSQGSSLSSLRKGVPGSKQCFRKIPLDLIPTCTEGTRACS